MNAQELFLSNGKAAGVYFCEKCRKVYREKAVAESCCEPYRCSVCGCETDRYWTKCNSCSNKEKSEEEAKRLEKAEIKVAYTFYLDGFGDEGFVFCLDSFHNDLLELDRQEIEDLPDYAFALSPIYPTELGAEDIIYSNWADSAHEDWEVGALTGLKELQAALDKFAEQNTEPLGYEVDYKHKIDIRDLKQEAIDELERERLQEKEG